MTAPAAPDRAPARLHIDWTRCDGHGLCHALAPDLIDLDEWGFPIFKDPASGHTAIGGDADLRRIVAACPALALRLSR